MVLALAGDSTIRRSWSPGGTAAGSLAVAIFLRRGADFVIPSSIGAAALRARPLGAGFSAVAFFRGGTMRLRVAVVSTRGPTYNRMFGEPRVCRSELLHDNGKRQAPGSMMPGQFRPQSEDCNGFQSLQR